MHGNQKLAFASEGYHLAVVRADVFVVLHFSAPAPLRVVHLTVAELSPWLQSYCFRLELHRPLAATALKRGGGAVKHIVDPPVSPTIISVHGAETLIAVSTTSESF